MNKQYTVYAAGPIAGTSYEECTAWRNKLRDSLPDHIGTWSPMRGKEYLAKLDAMPHSVEDSVLSSSRGINSRDHFDCTRSDMVVMNLVGATKVSIGTMIEIGWAHQAGVPIVLVMEPGNLHNHPMVRECASFICTNLDEAIHVVRTVLTCG